MYIEKDPAGHFHIRGMSIEQADAIQAALMRILPDLPQQEKREFIRLLQDFDRERPADPQ